MSKSPLGKLEPVSLREYWLREDSEFTPWLGLPENLKLLGDAIGNVADSLLREISPNGGVNEARRRLW